MYEVQTAFFNYWENCWLEDDKPAIFKTEKEAQEAIDDLIYDINQSVLDGLMTVSDSSEQSTYRIIAIS